ncbi:FAD dependent oxidoreductase, partial [Aspergillus pseudoustus]
DPRRFCHFLHDRCKELGVQFRFNAHAIALARSPTSEQFTSVTIEQTTPSGPSSYSPGDTTTQQTSTTTTTTTKTQTQEVLPCNALVVAAGPWTPRVLSTLLPNSTVKLRMNKTSSHTAGNHILIRNPHWNPDTGDDDDSAGGVTQVFFNNVLPGATRLDVTSFLGGYLYLGGWGAIPEDLPSDADKIGPQPGEIKAMLEVARRVLDLGSAEGEVEVVSAGRCYRPLAEPNRPVITRVPWGLLGDSRKRDGVGGIDGGGEDRISVANGPVSPVIGGLYINTAHNSDGMTLGPGSGKLMSELLLGRETSVPAGGFGLDNGRLERL